MAEHLDSITFTDHGAEYSGPRAVNVFRCKVVAAALRLYAKTGMKANRAYTPTAMLRVATEETGKHFKRGQYLEAAEALEALANSEASDIIAKQ